MADMRFDNAREKEQIRRMKEMQDRGECYLCTGYQEFDEGKPIWNGLHWFIKPNDFPYPGSVHHYMIVSNTHITSISEIESVQKKTELFQAISHLERELGTDGASLFCRSGNMAYTGATLDHLHWQYIVGVTKPAELVVPEDPKEKLKQIVENNILITLGYKKK